MYADRRLAARAERAGKRAFGVQLALGGAVAQRRERCRDALVTDARLDGERALADRGDELGQRGPGSAAEALESRAREHDRLELALLELAQPRVDIAAERHDRDVGAQREQLRAAPQAARADTRAAREAGQRARSAQAVERISSSGASGQLETLGEDSGHVLRGVHCQIDLAHQQRIVDPVDPAALIALGPSRDRRSW